ncbi:hypothetical protein GLOTRDRAFT_136424 [Gloeophyllum trabeum ATCC 11539]|uniref:C2 domain-containing protein n=1 Tax=Gloeophyllum trabeum (strain ATCC 11539 / FP-39264 / Madison 617) TaxID=670483 RepID=S7QJR9_GLOTA|nr:uncharacterized protein GLOTRDRAFT_136424 [Gloeophyllum trabeum ATCC 11539]EPQ59587.1 hypothetical protein GLOTRDRAFT_136424 [Gloeophyllum trabeum ATCC 11539]
MSYTPREIGTLIVVILKARNLPNKRHIGKQDPYCTVVYNNEKRRTKAIKRGGQHPEWDEEVRFTLYEDVDDELARTSNGGESPPPPPPKDDKAPRGVKGGKVMKLACYADDPREPDLIGETTVDLTEVLTKGETDEWFTLMHKERYSGEVYLELTFWSNAPPPKKKSVPKPVANKNQYGGAGSFVPADEAPPSSPEGTLTQSAVSSWAVSSEGARRDSVPGALRPSGSLAKYDLYVPPYERMNDPNGGEYSSAVDQMTNDFAEFGVEGHRGRAGSHPSVRNEYPPRSASAGGVSAYDSFSHHSHGFNQSSYSDGGSSYYDLPSAGSVHPGDNQSTFSTASQLPTPSTYSTPFDPTSQSGYPPFRAPPRAGPRYSIPSSSSGFMPLPAPSGFVPLASHPSEPSGFGAPPPAATPMPSGFMPVHTPAPSGFIPSGPSYQGQPQQAYPYYPYPPPPNSGPQQYAPQPPSSAPPQQHPLPHPPNSAPPLPHHSHSAPPQPYPGHMPEAPSPSHDQPILPQSTSSSLSTNGGSRPLPQQPQAYPPPQAPPRRQSSLPVPPPLPLQGQNQNALAVLQAQPAGRIPPPPPLPGRESSPHSYPFNVPPPPPLPASQLVSSNSASSTSSSGRPPLPQPPINYGGQNPQPIYQPIPPPPPPPSMQGGQPPQPPIVQPYSVNTSQAPYPGPPPRPPQMNGMNSQWSTPAGPPQTHYSPQWTGVAQQ